MGKTNLDQFATGLVGVRSPYGTPRAPFDPARVPGGSSSGSGAAVAAGIVPVALGTDTAGSGRIPAAFGNIVGLKPTIGAIPSAGMVPACRSIDTISVFARTVDEALAVTRVIAGYEPADPYSRPAPPGYLRRSAPPTLRIAAPADLSPCDPPVAAAFTTLATRIGATAIDLSPFLALARLLYDGPWVAERTAALRPMLARPDALHPTTRAILEGGLTRLATDAFDAFHIQAQTRRLAAALFETADVLLLPTAPCWPSLAELAADPIGPNSRLGTYTNFVNLCDLAAIAVPAGFTPAGTPVGVTLVGPAWSEGRLASPRRHDPPRRHQPRRRHPNPAPTPCPARPTRPRRDRPVLHRRPHVRPPAQPPAHRPRRSLPPRRPHPPRVPPARPRQPPRPRRRRCRRHYR